MKLRLIIQSGSQTGRQYELEVGSLLLGRGGDCGVQFDAAQDPGVSTRHAIIEAAPDGFFLTDQRSTNGTFVNGTRIQRAVLRNGDLFQLGNQGPQIRVNIEGLQPAPSPYPQQQYGQPNYGQPQYGQQQQYYQQPPPGPYYQQQPGPPPWGQKGGSQPFGQQGGSQPFGSKPLGSQPIGGPSLSEMPTAMWKEETGGTGLRRTVMTFGVYNPEKEIEKEKKPNYLGIGAVLALGGVMALIVLVLMIFSVGSVAGVLVGTILAFIPAPFYVLLFLWLDRYDPEPAWALVTAFAWGGLFAVIISLIVNTLFGAVAAALVGGPAGNTLGAVISAPLIEEGTKGLGVVLFLIFLRSEFDDILDGIVYAGVIALGFATVENVLYYGRTFSAQGGAGLLFIVFLRGVLSPFAHSLFTSMTGIGCGIARETHNKNLKIAMPIVGYLCAVFLHALWNGIASFLGGLFFIAYFIVWVPLFLVFAGVMFYMARREAGIIKQMLAIEVARGLITPQELELVGSFFGRLQWIGSSLSDWKRFQARRHFLRAATKLAFCYWHVARATAANSQTRSLPQIPKFQAEVMELKGQI